MTSALSSTSTTPIGPFTVIATASEIPVVLASGWTADPVDLLRTIAPTLRPLTMRTVRRIDGVTDAVAAYHEGELGRIGDVAVQQLSGDFLQHAWGILRGVPAGRPVTYTQLAVLAGRPAAIRAAAAACARNAVALFVPCHRVLRADGSLGGFRWGLPAKRWLLDHERAA
jgi:methylated-DNA-[protein]-cysteine S-methyltransferase